jgi:preprotein translocase subunit SecB
MAENGNDGQRPAQEAQPSVSVLVQYVKDLSFENPSAPDSLRPRENSPQISVSVGVNPRQLSGNDIEVELRIEVKAMEGENVIFAIELVYAGVFRLSNVTQETLNPIMFIQCPSLLFPFARHIIADASRNGGFPPLLLDPIDFVALFRQRVAGAAASAAAQPSQPN